MDKSSRRPDWKVEVENKIKNQKLIKKKLRRDLTEVVVKELET